MGRAVGPAVVRNTIKRRLRHLMRSRLGSLPAGSLLVVRALPSAATQTPAALAADLEGALRRVLAAQPAGDQTAGRRTAGSRGAS